MRDLSHASFKLPVERERERRQPVHPFVIAFGLLAVGLYMLWQELGFIVTVGIFTSPFLLSGVFIWRRWLHIYTLVRHRAVFPFRATRLMRKLFGHLGKVRLRRVRRQGPVWELAWRMPTKATSLVLKNGREVIQQDLDCSAEFWYDRGLVWMRAGTEPIPQVIGFESFYGDSPPAGELVVAIGVSRMGRVWRDLAKLPHLLVAGMPGFGKSVFLMQLITGLVQRHSPAELQLVLFDLKGGLEFNSFARLPHLMLPVVTDAPGCMPALEALQAELEGRQGMFTDAGVENIARWNQRYPERRLPYILVPIDEFAEVASAAESSDGSRRAGPKATLALISRLVRLGRAFGIHLIACTQRPDAEVMPGQIKAQFVATVAFRARNEVNSHVMLGDRNDAAALLPPWPGRAIFQHETELEVQTPLLGKEEAEALLAGVCAAAHRESDEERAA